jgi:hypothetical protein
LYAVGGYGAGHDQPAVFLHDQEEAQ